MGGKGGGGGGKGRRGRRGGGRGRRGERQTKNYHDPWVTKIFLVPNVARGQWSKQKSTSCEGEAAYHVCAQRHHRSQNRTVAVKVIHISPTLHSIATE